MLITEAFFTGRKVFMLGLGTKLAFGASNWLKRHKKAGEYSPAFKINLMELLRPFHFHSSFHPFAALESGK